MGGNAINDTVRLNSTDYFTLCDEVISRILKYSLEHPISSKNSIRFNVIKAYADKPTYGDMDIIIDDYSDFDYDGLIDSFNPSQIHKNGNVISFGYKNFQIDLIKTNPAIFDFANNYYSFNDLGNLMGRVAHSMGLSYGHQGLYYKIRKDNYKTKNILICTDSRSVFELLDYDYDVFLNGFDSLTDIFEYVKSSKYFTSGVFAFENRNHRARVRDKKRSTYTAFLEYIGEKPDFRNVKPHNGAYEDIDHHTDLSSHDKRMSFKDKMLLVLLEKYDNLQSEIDLFNNTYNSIKQFKSKFNATMVTEEIGLTTKDLGEFIQTHQYNVRNEEFRNFLFNSTAEQIRQRIREDYENVRIE